MGPGVVGTESELGTSALEAAPVLDTAVALGGRPVLCVRASEVDARPRHRGVSHHALTVLDLVRSPVDVPVPHGLVELLDGHAARHHVVEVEATDAATTLEAAGLSVTTMGRGPADDPVFFAAAASAGAHAVASAPRRCADRRRRTVPARRPSDGTGSVVANPKLERLMNLTAALLDTRVPLTAEALRERVGGYPDDRVAFRRSFERDKDDLREMGIPIRIEEIPDSLPRAEGYLIRNDEYYLRDPGLTADELAALHLATAAVRIDGVQGLGGLWKLGGTPGGWQVRPPTRPTCPASSRPTPTW